MCVRGAIIVDDFLGSGSTHVLSGLGGFQGRALRKGDILEIGAGPQDKPETCGATRVPEHLVEHLAPRKVLRVTPGPQSEWFPQTASRAFFESTYRVTEESNRMGLRLEGAAILPDPARSEMISEGVSLGAIQIPENGLPIILFVDQQTTGGYPKIANVITADLASVGQLRPRDEVRFEQVNWETARSLLQDQESLLQSEDLIVEQDQNRRVRT